MSAEKVPSASVDEVAEKKGGAKIIHAEFGPDGAVVKEPSETSPDFEAKVNELYTQYMIEEGLDPSTAYEKAAAQAAKITSLKGDIEKVFEGPVTETISDKDYESFVDTGKISPRTLKSIAEKVKDREKGDLSTREQAIFAARTAEVEKIIKKGDVKEEGKEKKEKPPKFDIPSGETYTVGGKTFTVVSIDGKKVRGIDIRDGAEISIDRKEVEGVIEKEGKNIATTLKQEFGFSPKEALDFQDSKDFKELSQGQKLFVLQQLEQQTYDRVQYGAKAAYEKSFQKAGFFGKIFKGMRKEYSTNKEAEKLAIDIRYGGAPAHNEVLGGIMEHLRTMNVPIIKNEHGELEMQFMTGEKMDKKFANSKEGRTALRTFNQAVSEFAMTPAEWKFGTAGKEKVSNYTEKEDAFKGSFASLKKHLPEKEVGLNYKQIFNKATLSQYLVTNPEAAQALDQLSEKSNKWKQFFKKDVVFERGLYIGGSMAARTGLGVAGYAALPISGLVGVIRGWRRAAGKVKDAEIVGRRGVESKASHAKNFIQAFDHQVKTRTGAIHERRGLTGKIEELIIAYNTAKTDEEKTKLANELSNRAAYAERKMTDGLINFGGDKDRLHNQAKFITTLSEAQAIGVVGNGSRVQDRLEKFLNVREKRVAKNQRNFKIKEASKAAVFSLAAAGVGYYIASEYFGRGGGNGGGHEGGSGNDGEGYGPIKNLEPGQYRFPDPDSGIVPPYAIGHAPGDVIPGGGTHEIIKSAKVEFSSKGAIQTIVDLKQKLLEQYKGVPDDQIPPSAKEIMTGNATKLAQKFGFYRPGETAESAMVYKHSTLEIDSAGNLNYHHVGQNTYHILEFSDGKGAYVYDEKMFDYQGKGSGISHGSGTEPGTQGGVKHNFSQEELEGGDTQKIATKALEHTKEDSRAEWNNTNNVWNRSSQVPSDEALASRGTDHSPKYRTSRGTGKIANYEDRPDFKARQPQYRNINQGISNYRYDYDQYGNRMPHRPVNYSGNPTGPSRSVEIIDQGIHVEGKVNRQMHKMLEHLFGERDSVTGDVEYNKSMLRIMNDHTALQDLQAAEQLPVNASTDMKEYSYMLKRLQQESGIKMNEIPPGEKSKIFIARSLQTMKDNGINIRKFVNDVLDHTKHKNYTINEDMTPDTTDGDGSPDDVDDDIYPDSNTGSLEETPTTTNDSDGVYEQKSNTHTTQKVVSAKDETSPTPVEKPAVTEPAPSVAKAPKAFDIDPAVVTNESTEIVYTMFDADAHPENLKVFQELRGEEVIHSLDMAKSEIGATHHDLKVRLWQYLNVLYDATKITPKAGETIDSYMIQAGRAYETVHGPGTLEKLYTSSGSYNRSVVRGLE